MKISSEEYNRQTDSNHFKPILELISKFQNFHTDISKYLHDNTLYLVNQPGPSTFCKQFVEVRRQISDERVRKAWLVEVHVSDDEVTQQREQRV